MNWLKATSYSTGRKVPPPNRKELFLSGGREVSSEEVRKVKAFVLHNGDRVVDFVQGGCSLGDPLERDVKAVGKDVRDELVSIESAEREYGVVVDPETLGVDLEKTDRLREQLREK